jgi:hypothetical protein
MWLRRKKRWPTINLYQRGGTGVIKVLSEIELDRLMGQAASVGWSADGRPEWFQQHRGQFQAATLVVFGIESPGVWRCIATVVLADGSGGRFTLDVSESDLDALTDMDGEAVVVLAHRYLATFPPLDLDEGQAATWDESVWKKWGEI